MEAYIPSNLERDMRLWRAKLDTAIATTERLQQDLQLAQHAHERDVRRWKVRAVGLFLFGLLGGLGLGELVGLWMR